MGFGAGGELAARVSSSLSRSYAEVDRVDSSGHAPDFALVVRAAGDPSHALHAAPTFLASAQDDPCVRAADVLDYYAALRAAGPAHELHLFPGRRGGGPRGGDPGGHNNSGRGGGEGGGGAWAANAQLWLEHHVLSLRGRSLPKAGRPAAARR